MNKSTYSSRSVILLSLLLLLLAACGTERDGAELPRNDNPDVVSGPSATCIADEPDCEDFGATDQTSQDLPDNGSGDAPPSVGMPVNGGLTVSEALVTDATGVLAVKGFLVADSSVALFCELLAESFPPQCGGASISIVGYDEVVSVPLKEAQGVTWTDDVFTVFGEIIGGVLVVDNTVSG